MLNTKNCLILIPAFNEEANILDTVQALKRIFPNILVIDDCSTDSTYQIISNNSVCVLRHIINIGQGGALQTGFFYFINHTQYDFLITYDADGQHQPSDALKLLNHAYASNLDALFASRFLSKTTNDLAFFKDIPYTRRFFLRIANLFEKIFLGSHLSDSHNGLRVLNRHSVSKLLNLRNLRMAHASEIRSTLQRNNITTFKCDNKMIRFGCQIMSSKVFIPQ